MRKQRLKGTKIKLLISFFAIIFSCSAVSDIFQSNEQLAKDAYDKGQVYKQYTLLYANPVAIKVFDIDKTSIEINETTLYLIKHEYGYVMLAAEKNNTIVRDLFHRKQSLKEQPAYVMTTFVPTVEKVGRRSKRLFTNVTVDLYTDFLRAVPKDAIIGSEYVSLKRFNDSQVVKHLIGFGGIIISIFLWITCTKRIKQNLKMYTIFEEYFPEVTFGYGIIASNASYKDKKLHLYVYKDTLIVNQKSFIFIPLEEIASINYTTYIRKVKNSTVTIFQLSVKKTNRQTISLVENARNLKLRVVLFYEYLEKHNSKIRRNMSI
ncbi:hypothetical protein GMA11_06295 [Granulicatella sp. zg-ZJ]|uniref:hypothetical protein n=1 Tax=unclassified Granulicatella TaxID=2630493 RepID=UPI0013C21ECB|nr:MULTISPECIES: hypothetical protein [unclassified Granulicatella]MBS4749562.1 hypothetical protein [Carnobacteriaceae bacterium zg-ZUI78]QMI86494.1 hypothetical protein H1220_03885 [Carnobacteriaceae bacterium zg-84]NEW62456.1 hypothetical protein [Granulicatella sp. zg-ZJ]NEW63002.1 hypothetical protein [Granulicatella sp. zg-ZJ]NEW65754.1 hypothetical protein [Granulicatella sp. zg-84]